MAKQAPRARFEELYRAHARAVLAYALRRTPRSAAQDVAAETFLVAWRRLDDVPHDALPWLLGVARRTLANERRGTARRNALVERLAQEARTIIVVDDAPPVLEALQRLPEPEREVLRLATWEGLDAGAAGRVLGCSPGAFRLRLHRARRRLRRELAALERSPVHPWQQEVESA
jgi:RNA polymerase sigma factor (sigma-70 family)